MGLHDLATTILLLNHGPISRVRFSRTIYFVHKELVRKKLMQLDDIAYLRLPLGPVPEGFMTLAIDLPNIIVQPIASPTLSYEAEEFALSDTEKSLDSTSQNPQQLYHVVEKTLAALKTHSTSELVAASHDQSWLAHANGERYFLTTTDLKNTFPFITISLRFRIKRPANNEIGLLQATLLRGMLNDIVRESTDLEYPDEPSNSTKGAGNETKTEQKPNIPQSPEGN